MNMSQDEAVFMGSVGITSAAAGFLIFTIYVYDHDLFAALGYLATAILGSWLATVAFRYG